MGELSEDPQFVVEMGNVVGFGMENSDVSEATDSQDEGNSLKSCRKGRQMFSSIGWNRL